MADFHQFSDRFAYEPFHIVHILFELFRGRSETVVIIPAVYEIFRYQFYSALFFKIRHQHGIRRLRVPEPFHLLLFSEVVENQRELIQKRRESHHVRFRVLFAPFLHMLRDILLRRRKRRVVRQLLLARPFVRYVIVYLHRVPRYARKKRYRVFVEFFAIFYRYDSAFLVCPPVAARYFLSRGAIVYLPQSDIRIVRREFVREKSLHDFYFRCLAYGKFPLRKQKYPLRFFRVLPRPVVISTHHEIRVVHLPELPRVLRQTRSVAVTHRVRSPFLRDRFRPFHEILVRRYCKSSFLHFFTSLLLSFLFFRIYQPHFSCSQPKTFFFPICIF